MPLLTTVAEASSCRVRGRLPLEAPLSAPASAAAAAATPAPPRAATAAMAAAQPSDQAPGARARAALALRDAGGAREFAAVPVAAEAAARLARPLRAPRLLLLLLLLLLLRFRGAAVSTARGWSERSKAPSAPTSSASRLRGFLRLR